MQFKPSEMTSMTNIGLDNSVCDLIQNLEQF